MEKQQQQPRKRATHFGAVGWGLIIFSALCFMVTGSFWPAAAANVLVPQFTALLGFSDTSTILLANSICTFCAIGYCFVFTWLMQRFKPRVINCILLIILGVGVFIAGHVNTLGQYIAVWIFVIGSAITLGQATLSAQIGTYMPTKNGSALGWATIGCNLGTIVAVPIMNALIGTQRGFPLAMLVFGLYLILLGILNFVFWPNDPAKRHYELDNGDISMEELAAIKKARDERIVNWTYREMFTNKNFWCIALGYGIEILIGAGIGGQLIVFLVANGIGMAAAITAFSIAGAIGIVGSLTSGYLDQIFSVRIAAMICMCFYAVAGIAAGFFHFGTATMVLLVIGYGFVMGAGSNLPPSHGLNCFGTDFTLAFRIIAPIMIACSASGSLVLGLAQRMTGSYVGAYKVFTILCIPAFLLFLWSDTRQSKKPGEKPVRIHQGDKRLEKLKAKEESNSNG